MKTKEYKRRCLNIESRCEQKQKLQPLSDDSFDCLWTVADLSKHLRINPKEINSFLLNNPDFPVIRHSGEKRTIKKFSRRQVLLWEDSKVLGLDYREMLNLERRKELN